MSADTGKFSRRNFLKAAGVFALAGGSLIQKVKARAKRRPPDWHAFSIYQGLDSQRD